MAGGNIYSDTERQEAQAADPAAILLTGVHYTKVVAGVVHFFYRASDGTVYQLTPTSSLFEAATIYVDGTFGNDATGQRATTNAFATVTAALAAALSGDTIIVRPGTYAENIVMPDLDNLSISGTGDPAATVLEEPPAGGHTISWVPAAVSGPSVHRFSLRNLTVANGTAGSDAIHIDGNAVFFPSTFMDTALEISNVVVTKALGGNALFLRCTGTIITETCVVDALTATSALRVRNCTLVVTRETTLEGLVDLEYEAGGGNPTPATGRSIYAFTVGTFAGDPVNNGTTGTTTLRGHPTFFVDRASTIDGVTSAVGGVNATLLTAIRLGPGADYEPIIVINGTIGSPAVAAGVRITFPASVAASTAVAVFEGSFGIFNGPLHVDRPVLGPTPFQLARAREGSFLSAVVGSVRAGPNVNLDIRGSSFVQAALAVTGPAGTIDRSTHVLVGVLSVPAPAVPVLTPVAIVPALPSGVYHVAMTPTGAVTKSCSVTALTGTGFSFAKSAAGGTWDVLVTRGF